MVEPLQQCEICGAGWSQLSLVLPVSRATVAGDSHDGVPALASWLQGAWGPRCSCAGAADLKGKIKTYYSKQVFLIGHLKRPH